MRIAIAVLAAVPTLAVAKPLPQDMKAIVKGRKALIESRGVTVPVADRDFALRGDDVKKIELSDDGKSVVVTYKPCMGDDETLSMPLASVAARIENSLGMLVHVKKKYDEAIAHFTLAASMDPDTALFATNLLSAQSMAGKLDEADRAIDTYGPKNPAWLAWRLAVDPELKNIKARPKALAATKGAKRGHARAKQLFDVVAYSPLGGGLAATAVYESGDMLAQHSFVVTSVATGRELLRLPFDEACVEAPDAPPDMKCDKKALAANARNAKQIDELLATLGFEPAGKWQEAGETTKSPDGTIVVELKDKLRVTRGKASRDYEPVMWYRVAFVPNGMAMYVKHGNTCGGTGLPHTLETVAAP
jgi:hypothetical protein